MTSLKLIGDKFYKLGIRDERLKYAKQLNKDGKDNYTNEIIVELMQLMKHPAPHQIRTNKGSL